MKATKKVSPPDGAKLKEEIKEKFKTLARFAKIVNKDYHAINAILNGKDPQALMDMHFLIRCTNDTQLLGELTSGEKMRIRMAIMTHAPQGRAMSMKAFCKEYKFDQTWLSRLLSEADYGAVRTNSPNLKRLLKILNLNL